MNTLNKHTSPLESFQDFLIKLDMKTFMHLVETSIFLLNNVTARPTKIMCSFMSNWIKKSWKDSNHHPTYTINVMALCGSTYETASGQVRYARANI